jgi:hypothetical protein
MTPSSPFFSWILSLPIRPGKEVSHIIHYSVPITLTIASIRFGAPFFPRSISFPLSSPSKVHHPSPVYTVPRHSSIYHLPTFTFIEEYTTHLTHDDLTKPGHDRIMHVLCVLNFFFGRYPSPHIWVLWRDFDTYISPLLQPSKRTVLSQLSRSSSTFVPPVRLPRFQEKRRKSPYPFFVPPRGHSAASKRSRCFPVLRKKKSSPLSCFHKKCLFLPHF